MKSFWSAAFLILLVSVAANLVLYYIGLYTGMISHELPMPDGAEQVTEMPVIMASVMSAVAALLIFGLFVRFSSQAYRFFRITAIIGLLLSFALPFALPEAPVGMILILNLMHVSVVVALLYFLGRYTRARAVTKKA